LWAAQLKTNNQSTFSSPRNFDLAQRSGLLQPTEVLLDQPSAAETDGIPGLACGAPIQIAAAFLLVLRSMGGPFSSRAVATKSFVS
jgi:hypothetical protein